jgi:hypothetical protein
MEKHNFKSLRDENFQTHIRTQTKAADWGILGVYRNQDHIAEKIQAVQAIGGHVLGFLPRDSYDDPRELLIRSAELFGPKSDPQDQVHFSEEGHVAMANKIGDLLYKMRGTGETPQRPMIDDTRIVGDWVGGKDYCLSWMETGDTSMILQTSDMEMVEFPRKKYALETQKEISPVAIPFFTFNNPFNHSQEFYLTHMVMGPRKDHYPVTWVYLDNAVKSSDPLEIHPHIRAAYHITENVLIGTVQPGKNTVYLKESTSIPTENHFRVTGFIMTPHNPDTNTRMSL